VQGQQRTWSQIRSSANLITLDLTVIRIKQRIQRCWKRTEVKDVLAGAQHLKISEKLHTAEELDTYCQYLTVFVDKLVDLTVSWHKPSSYEAVWWSPEVKETIQQKRKARRIWRTHRTVEAWETVKAATVRGNDVEWLNYFDYVESWLYVCSLRPMTRDRYAKCPMSNSHQGQGKDNRQGKDQGLSYSGPWCCRRRGNLKASQVGKRGIKAHLSGADTAYRAGTGNYSEDKGWGLQGQILPICWSRPKWHPRQAWITSGPWG